MYARSAYVTLGAPLARHLLATSTATPRLLPVAGLVRMMSAVPHSFPPAKPAMVRDEFLKPLTTEELEKLDIGLTQHRTPANMSDRIALRTVKSMRVLADTFFRKRYLHRAVTLETVAAVPGMVAGMHRHLRSLRRLQHDGGWIGHLLAEAENERMHLLTWMRVANPTLLERGLVFSVQATFFSVYFMLYLLAPKTAHRIVGYLEEEAIISYTQMLEQIDTGKIKNIPAPDIAIEYWNMPATATLRDVTLAVRADEAMHRDANHDFADRILQNRQNLREKSKSDITHSHRSSISFKPPSQISGTAA